MSQVPSDISPRPSEKIIKNCYHCGLPVPKTLDEKVIILGEARPMCCLGCHAVAAAIVDSGMEAFYKHRTANATTAEPLVPDFLDRVRLYDNDEVQSSFVQRFDSDLREAVLILEGITCAACVWLNEKHLNALDGVADATVNYSTHRMRVRWDNSQIKLSEIMAAVAQLGYKALPFDVSQHREILDKERKQQLKRLGLAGVLGMQIMMLAAGLYLGDYMGMADRYRGLLNWASFVLVLPIIGYSGLPFYRAAWRDLKVWQAGMDVPVSLGILGAFFASTWNTINLQGHVYYDSIAMFVFFLLCARYFELQARTRAADSTERLLDLKPAMATRVDAETGVEQIVAVAEIAINDRVRVKAGEVIPTDGVIIEGVSSVDESLLTGESLPKNCRIKQTVIGGSINVESPLLIEVTKIGQDTVLSHMLRLIDRAQSEKPVLTKLADRSASYFVFAVLLMTIAVAIYWGLTAPEKWIPITISVLVVTCPCALSLATPTALTAASGHLTAKGVLITRSHALETLAKVSDVVFDKTGTLTKGHLSVEHVEIPADIDRQFALSIAATLEQYSEHPVGKAIYRAVKTQYGDASDVVNTPGKGIAGRIEGKQYYIGSEKFILENCQLNRTILNVDAAMRTGTHVCLAESKKLIAIFYLHDELRTDAKALMDQLRRDGKTIHLFSGDNTRAVNKVAEQIGIQNAVAELSPKGKLEALQALQNSGATVAMVGDGVNDAAVLAAAEVSIAMGSGAQAAMSNADIVLVADRLDVLGDAFNLSTRTLRIIRQNIVWAISYNTLVLPAAAMGWVAPWMAAIGMSLSSLLVVANAMRLSRSNKNI